MTSDVPLAKDANGQPFDLAPEVVKWQVMRADGPGRPVPAYDHLGDAILVEVNATHLDLLKKAGPGRYRLLPADATGRVFSNLPIAVTGPMQSGAELRNDAHGASNAADSSPSHVGARASSDDVRDELVRALCTTQRETTQTLQAVVASIPQILIAAGQLIGAADGAKLTTRQPLVLDAPVGSADDDEDDDTPQLAPSGPPDWLWPTISQCAGVVVPAIMAKLKPSGVANANATAPQAASAASSAPSAPAAPPRAAPSARATTTAAPHERPGEARKADAAPTTQGAQEARAAGSTQLEPAALAARVGQMWEALTTDERAQVERHMAALSPEDRWAWVRALGPLAVDDGVARIRAELARFAVAASAELEAAPPAEIGGAS